MFGAYGFGQGYFGQGPLESAFHQPITAEPLTLRRITSQVARPDHITGESGTIRRKTSGRSALTDIKGSH